MSAKRTVLVAVEILANVEESLPDDEVVAAYVHGAVAGDRLNLTPAQNGTGGAGYWEIGEVVVPEPSS